MACNCHRPDHDCRACRDYVTMPFTGLERYGPPNPYVLLEEMFAELRPGPAPEPKAEPIRVCKTCRYFDQENRGCDLIPIAGECRRGAPTYVSPACDGKWPVTLETDYCGEWAEGRP